jgi:hypothetical protein
MESWFVNDCRNEERSHLWYILGIIVSLLELIALFAIAFVMISLCFVPVDIVFIVMFGFCFGMTITFIIKHMQDFVKLIKDYKKWIRKQREYLN